MGQKIAKLKHSSYETYIYKCPGCKFDHQVPVKGKVAWGWNGCKVLPSFSPSILQKSYVDPNDWERPLEQVCHHFVKDGHIEFLSDCSHDLAGKTIAMADVPADWLDHGSN